MRRTCQPSATFSNERRGTEENSITKSDFSLYSVSSWAMNEDEDDDSCAVRGAHVDDTLGYFASHWICSCGPAMRVCMACLAGQQMKPHIHCATSSSHSARWADAFVTAHALMHAGYCGDLLRTLSWPRVWAHLRWWIMLPPRSAGVWMRYGGAHGHTYSFHYLCGYETADEIRQLFHIPGASLKKTLANYDIDAIPVGAVGAGSDGISLWTSAHPSGV